MVHASVRRPGVWLLLLAGLALSAAAQDVTIVGPDWIGPGSPPATLPRPYYSTLTFAIPDDQRQRRDIGYAAIPEYIDPRGPNIQIGLWGVSRSFATAFSRALYSWPLRPAVDRGRPVGGNIWLAAIFNPASAAADRRDATPRLLAVSPIFVDKKGADAIGHRGSTDATIEVSASGAVVGVKLPARVEAAARAIRSALAAWRFAPARQDGRPIAAAVSIQLQIETRPPDIAPGNLTPPRPIKKVEPDYPLDVRRLSEGGKVAVAVVVDRSGMVADATVVESNNPALNRAVLDALKDWRYEPGMFMGKPFAMMVIQPFVFEITGAAGQDAYRVAEEGEVSKLPADMRYDTPPKIIGARAPVFPHDLLDSVDQGSALVAMLINKEGRVASTHVLKASQPEFGLALEAAADGFRYRPAMRGTLLVATIIAFKQDFDLTMADGDLGAMVADDRSLARKLAAHRQRLVPANRLDHPLRPIAVILPVYPSRLRDAPKPGSAVVEVIIDDFGDVRLPRFVSATDPAFGYAAVQAVSDWRFVPPTVGGKPVMTAVRIPFDFRFGAPAARR